MRNNVSLLCGNTVVTNQDKLVTNNGGSTQPNGFDTIVCTNPSLYTHVVRGLSTTFSASSFSLFTPLIGSLSTLSTGLITETTNLINI